MVVICQRERGGVVLDANTPAVSHLISEWWLGRFLQEAASLLTGISTFLHWVERITIIKHWHNNSCSSNVTLLLRLAGSKTVGAASYKNITQLPEVLPYRFMWLRVLKKYIVCIYYSVWNEIVLYKDILVILLTQSQIIIIAVNQRVLFNKHYRIVELCRMTLIM